MRDELLVVVGDTMLDVDIHGDCDRVCPHAPVPVVDCSIERDHPGGAALAALSATWEDRDREVVLLTALAADGAGCRIRELLKGGIGVYALPLDGPTRRRAHVHADDGTVTRLDFGGGHARRDTDTTCSGLSVHEIVASAYAVLVSDHACGMAAHPAVRTALAALSTSVPVAWNPHQQDSRPVLAPA